MYEVLARKWRPQKFSELIGQDSVVRTLSHAILKERIASAYLFTGPRGIGKTSVARILAKAINCLNPNQYEPCSDCDNCQAIALGHHLDVLEIDGASNRGIDQIRDLRDNVQFAPASAKYKIYIIDEVHMLTQEAFNALLKTLEEPPAHVKFMFATTEPHRLPNTILSRCQRFDLNKISDQHIATHLETIAKAENILVEKGVFELIARTADGAMRDAESILDQLAVFADEKVQLSDAYQMLGTAGEDFFISLIQSVIENDFEKAFALIEDADKAGKDFGLLLLEWLNYLRKMILCKRIPKIEFSLQISAECQNQLSNLSQRLDEEKLLDWIELVCQTYDRIRFFPQKRVLFETCLVRSFRLMQLISIDQIIDGLDSGEFSEDISPQIQEGSQKKNIETIVPRMESSSKVVAPGSWQDVLQKIGQEKPICRAYLNEAKFQIKEGVACIQLPTGKTFIVESLCDMENFKFIESMIHQVFQSPMKVKIYEGKLDDLSQSEIVSKVQTPQEKKSIQSWDDRLQNHEVVQKAIEIFNGKIEEIH